MSGIIKGRRVTGYAAVRDDLVNAGKEPVLSYWGWPDVWPDWTRPGRERQPFQVDVYAACDQEVVIRAK